MRSDGRRLFALVLSLALHAVVLAYAGHQRLASFARPHAPPPRETVISLELLAPPPPGVRERPAQAPVASRRPAVNPSIHVSRSGRPSSTAARQPAAMQAPLAPSAHDWALAGSYTLKNSKRYRYTWGWQVRSMMGTAVAGPDQGAVRFLVEIAPDGTLARLQTLWTTSDLAERLARKAIATMPPLPPTPTGQPLVFERTIWFSAFASDAPPIYADDCLPEPPPFEDPFAWDGKSPQVRRNPQPQQQPTPQQLEECRRQIARDAIEAEAAENQRQFDRWGSSKLER